MLSPPCPDHYRKIRRSHDEANDRFLRSGVNLHSQRWHSPPKIRFAPDSPLEGRRFEPSVPRRMDDAFETALFGFPALPVPPERPTRFARGTGGSNPLRSASESVPEFPSHVRRGNTHFAIAG